MSKFSNDLRVDQDGFELYYTRFDDGLKSMNEIATFLKKLSTVESRYAKELSGLSKTDDPKLWKRTEKEVGTLQACWTSFHNELIKIAKQHEALAEKLSAQSNTLEKFQKDKSAVQKNLLKEGKKFTKEIHDAQGNLKRAKDTYYKDSKTADEVEASYQQKKSGGQAKPKDLEKMNKKAVEAREKAQNSDGAYKKMVEAANVAQNKFYETDMPSLLESFQKEEEERTSQMKSTFNGWMQTMNQLPTVLTSVCEALNKSVEQIDPSSDVTAFINAHKSEAAANPSEILYEPVGGGSTSLGTSSGTPKKPGSGLAGSSTLPAKPVKTSDGGLNGATTISTSKSPSASTPVAVAAASSPGNMKWGLSPDDASLSAAEKKKKLDGQLEQIKTQIKGEVKSKKGLDKLAMFYANDPVAQKKAQQEAAELDAKINGLKDEKKKILSQLAELEGGGAAASSPRKSGDDSGEKKAASPRSADGEDEEEIVEVSAKALFDYEAANDTELGFKAGDILTITEQDESGWWYAELKGKQGFIPNNYVEVLKS